MRSGDSLPSDARVSLPKQRRSVASTVHRSVDARVNRTDRTTGVPRTMSAGDGPRMLKACHSDTQPRGASNVRRARPGPRHRICAQIAPSTTRSDLRAFITVLVVAHHAMIAYNALAPQQTASLVDKPRWWNAFPVIDSQRSLVWAIFNAFNDGFFMALMFFISGLFVWASLRRRGAGPFIRERVIRLGVPFIVAASLIAPVAYFPSYLQHTTDRSIAGFVRQWLALGEWPAGPAWVIWLLLAFDAAFAIALWLRPR
jgi:Acyltransferase family